MEALRRVGFPPDYVEVVARLPAKEFKKVRREFKSFLMTFGSILDGIFGTGPAEKDVLNARYGRFGKCEERKQNC